MAIYVYEPIFPIEAANRGISEDIIGLIFSAHGIPSIILVMLMGRLMNKRKKFFLVLGMSM